MKNKGALARQVSGSHYKNYKIQPVEFCQENELNFCEASIVKYACRWDTKGQPEEDLKKIIHFAEILLDLYLKQKYGSRKKIRTQRR